MHVPLKVFVALTAAVGSVAPALCQTQGATVPWSQELVQAAIAACRTSILNHTTRDYLARHNLAESQLPPDFQERIAPVLNPLLLTCDCTVARLSKEVPYEKFQADSPEVQRRVKELVSKGGSCEPKAGN